MSIRKMGHNAEFVCCVDQGAGASADNVAISRCASAMAKYPQPCDVYECHLYPGRQCTVLRVSNAQVTFQWLGEYDRLEPQVVPVNRFIVDFKLVDVQE